MKKRIIGLCLTAGLILSSVLPAHAEEIPGESGWNVVFTAGNKLETNFKKADIVGDTISAMQPGDKVIFTINLKNQNSNVTDWYMRNKIKSSLEDGSVANGGAYTYKLSYSSPNTKEPTVFYDSEQVGGEKDEEDVSGNNVSGGTASGNNVSGGTVSGGGAAVNALSGGEEIDGNGTDGSALPEEDVPNDDVSGDDVSSNEGLHEVDDSLKEWFEVDTLSPGQSGKITLEVALDGETQGNNYQDTLAELLMEFAVERRPSPTNTYRSPKEVIKYLSELLDEEVPLAVKRDTVRTSDDDRLIFFAVLTFTSGLALFLLSLYCRKAGRKEEE